LCAMAFSSEQRNFHPYCSPNIKQEQNVICSTCSEYITERSLYNLHNTFIVIFKISNF